MKYLKPTATSTYQGREFVGGTWTAIPSGTEFEYAYDSTVLADITAEVCQVSVNGTDVVGTVAQQIAALQGQNIRPVDTDGAQIVRLKAAKAGWAFRALGVEFTTAALDSLYCEDYTGATIPFVTCKYYNSSDTEVTTPGLLGANLATIVKTVVDIEPTYDYEIIGGSLRLLSTISDDCRLWIVAAPDIPAAYGGSREMASGVNLRYISSTEAFTVDGRVTKYMTYSATTHQGKLRFIFKHAAGLQATIMFLLDHYKL